MSKLLNKTIYIPASVSCELKRLNNNWLLWVTGPFGTSKTIFPGVVNLQFFPGTLQVRLTTEQKQLAISPNITQFIQLTVRIQKALISCSVGFKSYLRVRGVGYRITSSNANVLTVIAGFSHPIVAAVHPEIKISSTRKFRMVRLKSRNLMSLTNALARLRNLKKPDVYRGKGIRYRIEHAVQKEGKKRKSF